ncbi:MAG: type VI secretion system baseplate subunit TssG [Acetobacteraceae bacterium]
MSASTPLERLAREPRRFGFDAAVRLVLDALQSADPAAIRFRTLPGLAYPPAEVMGFAPGAGAEPPRLTVAHMGLAGPMGVLPRFYTEILDETLRGRSMALQDFLDLLAMPMIAAFAAAGSKYRLHRAAERARLAGGTDEGPVSAALLAFTGYFIARLAERLTVGAAPLMHYSGLFAERVRSAERLAALASDWLGRPVEVVQFAGGWLALPVSERTRLRARPGPAGWHRLGWDAAIGVRAWSPAARVVLRIGPLDRQAFEALLPDRPALRRLVALIRAFLGFETAFAVNLVLMREEVPALRLDARADPPPRLGWNTWLPVLAPAGAGVRGPAAEPLFEADVVEAQGVGR